MRRAISAYDPGTVQRKNHTKILQCYALNNLIIGPLQKSRVNGCHRFKPFMRQAGGKADSVPFGDPHIKESLREIIPELIQACALRHRSGHRDNLRILSSQLHQRPAKDLGISLLAGQFFRDGTAAA